MYSGNPHHLPSPMEAIRFLNPFCLARRVPTSRSNDSCGGARLSLLPSPPSLCVLGQGHAVLYGGAYQEVSCVGTA
jgi:hypothetical protein